MRLKLHLPQAVTCSYVALSQIQVFIVLSNDVGDEQTIIPDDNLCFEPGQVQGFVRDFFGFSILPESPERVQEFTQWRNR